MRQRLALVIPVLAVTLAGCAATPARVEAPHHYSRDAHGHRTACYATEVANEYECYPVRHAHVHDPFYDPFWPAISLGLYYGWPWYAYGHHHHHHHHRGKRR